MFTKSEAESALSIHVKVWTNKNKSKVDVSITESKETKPRHFRPTVDGELSQQLDCLTDNKDPISENLKVKSAKSDQAYFRTDGEGSIMKGSRADRKELDRETPTRESAEPIWLIL